MPTPFGWCRRCPRAAEFASGLCQTCTLLPEPPEPFRPRTVRLACPGCGYERRVVLACPADEVRAAERTCRDCRPTTAGPTLAELDALVESRRASMPGQLADRTRQPEGVRVAGACRLRLVRRRWR